MSTEAVTLVVTDGAHSALGASSAERWSACPGSIALSRGVARRNSRAAAEGTAAHAVAERRLRGEPFADFVQVGDFLIEVDEAMREHVDGYVEYVRDLCKDGSALLLVETEVDLTAALGQRHDGPLGKLIGTADALLLADDTLTVVDFKYGSGKPVKVEGNPQLSLYAVGAVAHPVVQSLANSIDVVRLVVYQPRVYDEPQVEELPFADLIERTAGLAVAAAKVAEALRKFDDVQEPSALAEWADAYLVPGPVQCRWCPAKAAGACLALNSLAADTAKSFKALGIGEPDNVKLGELRSQVELVRQWADAIEELTRDRLLAGEQVAGWKLVAGRHGPRKWENAAKAEAALRALGLPEDLVAPRSVISPTAAEKLVKAGKLSEEQWAGLVDLIVATAPAPTVVPETDKRPALEVAGVADEFESLA
jgi:hypothetical protein